MQYHPSLQVRAGSEAAEAQGLSAERKLHRAIFGAASEEPSEEEEQLEAVIAMSSGEAAEVLTERNLVMHGVVFKQAYRADPMELVTLVKRGVTAESVQALAKLMSISKERLADTLGLASATVNRKSRNQKRFDSHMKPNYPFQSKHQNVGEHGTKWIKISWRFPEHITCFVAS